MSVEKKVSAIVVNWNGIKFLPACLGSIFEQSYKNMEVIVVDCASKDESVPFIKSNYPLTKVIELKQDFGPPYAINLASRQAQGEYILILNNDVCLPENLVAEMVEELKKDENCVINPVELSFEGEYLRSGWPSWIGSYLFKLIKLKGDRPFFPSTACCLLSKDLILKYPLNEHLFMYEDTEWGWRLQLNKTKFKVLKDGYFLHRGSGSEDTPYSPRQGYFVGRATIATCFICFKIPTLIFMLPILTCNYLRQVLGYLKRKKIKSVFAYTKGHFAFFGRLGVFLQDRKVTQMRREIKDREVLKLIIGSIDFANRSKKQWEEKELSRKSAKKTLFLTPEVLR